MRRLSLSKKLFAAALPLVLAVAALLALTVRADLNEVHQAERSAELGRAWTPLVAAIQSVEGELATVPGSAASMAAPSAGADTGDAAQADRLAAIATSRRATDQSIAALTDPIDRLDSSEAARKHITAARSMLSAARRTLDMATLQPGVVSEIDPIASYSTALRELVSIGQLLPAESNDAVLGRELLGVVKLAEARVAADAMLANMSVWLGDTTNPGPLATAKVHFADVESLMAEFGAIAPDEWATQYRQLGFTTQLSKYRLTLDSSVRFAESGAKASFDLAGFAAVSDQSLQLQSDITESIIARADASVASTRQAALVRSGIILGAVAAAAIIAWLLTRSVTRRVRTVSRRANQVATEQLPALVEALRDPRTGSVPEFEPIKARGGDELTELAEAFNSMQSTLVDVANEQVEVLRRGVSDIFVTMARRNRSLIDRQLAMLDEFEAEVDDASVLSNYYQLDHMATRMRRNSESLLVLANAEPKRRRVKATEIDDVVRAAIGEVEDYRRIDIEALESLQVRGNVVADVSHLLAELLDNATSFSPPDSVVRVGGRRAGESYMLRIVDHGVGVATERLRELNELLREPPIVGLSVEPTLGMSVVSLLANRHDVTVSLSQGNPGLTVDVLLPSSLFGPIDSPHQGRQPAAPVVAAAPAPAAAPSDITAAYAGVDYEVDYEAAEAEFAPASHATSEGLVAWDEEASFPTDDLDQPVDDEAQRVRSWTSMSLDLSSHLAQPSIDPGLPTPVADTDPDAFRLDYRPAEATLAVPGVTADDTLDIEQFVDSTQPVEFIPLPTYFESGPDSDVFADERQDAAPMPALTFDPFDIPPAPALDPLLPPMASAARGEFDRPPAPPITVDGSTARPFAADDAMATKPLSLPGAAPALPGLPTRSPGRGPDGPDRMAGMTGSSNPFGAPPSVNAETPVTTSSPSALQAALSAFDSRRPSGDSLPTRSPRPDALPASFEETVSVTQSRLDPEALRERLRAFQTEFRTAAGGGSTTNPSSTDLEGNPR